MKSGILKNIVTALIVTLAVSGIGTCLALRTLTLVDTWIVAAIAVCAAFPLTAALTRKQQSFQLLEKSLRLAIWQIIVTSLLCGAFYGVNYAGADEDHTTTADATVERRYYKERQRTRRVGRGRYVATGEKIQAPLRRHQNCRRTSCDNTTHSKPDKQHPQRTAPRGKHCQRPARCACCITEQHT